MNKRQQLLKLQRITQHQEDKAAMQLAQMDKLIQEKKRQLAVLIDYRSQDKPQSQATQRLPMLYQNYQAFLAKIAEAIDAETNTLEAYEMQRLQQLKNYQNIALRRKLLAQWIEKLQQQQRKKLEQHDERQLDEIMEGVRKWVQTLC